MTTRAADTTIIFGAGREAEACLRELAESKNPPRCIVLDDDPKRAAALAERFPALAQAAREIEDVEALLRGSDAMLLRAPSVRLEHPAIVWAQERGIPHTTFTGLWLARHRDRVAATVTGTKGKSTTSVLLAEILTAAGMPTSAAGNLGVPPRLDESRPDERFVLEMSSYQLSDAPLAAPVHVITNLLREHLDWHGGVESYWAAKRRPLVLDPACVGVVNRSEAWVAQEQSNPFVFVDDAVDIQPDRITATYNDVRASVALRDVAEPLTGVRAANFATALAAALATSGADPALLVAAAARVAASFVGLPSRQAVIGDFAGRIWVDDALATIPEATLAALDRWANARVHLVIGGKDRGVDLGGLADQLRARPNVTVHAYGPTGERLATLLDEPAAWVDRDFAATIASAFHASAPGDVILFSPAAATFEPGWSYEHRSRVFGEVARKLAGATSADESG